MSTRTSPKTRRFALTRSGDIFITLTLLTSTLALAFNNNYMVILACCMLSFFIISGIMSSLSLKKIHVRRVLPDHAFGGEAMPYHMIVRLQRRWFPSLMISFKDHYRQDQRLTATDQNPLLPMLRPRQIVRVNIATGLLRRGKLNFQGISMTAEFPPGFIRATRTLPLEDEMLIFPRRAVVTTPVTQILDRTREADFERVPVSSHGYAEWAGLRDFRPGDNPKHIYWKSYGRTPDQLLLKEFENYRTSRAMILLDTYIPRSHAHRFRIRLETAISCSMALAEELTARNCQVTLMTFADAENPEPSFLPVAEGAFRRMPLYEFLARIQPNPHHTLEELLRHPETTSGQALILVLSLSQDRPHRDLLPNRDEFSIDMRSSRSITYIKPSEMRSWIRFAH